MAINKPEAWTSFDVVNRLRRLTGIRKVGHAGTLDPFATGVLLVCFAGATKEVDRLMELDKEYAAVIDLGKQTDTDDVTGKVIRERPYDDVTRDAVEEKLASYRGEFYQTPPAFSAVKLKGQRLYKLARRGEAVEAPPRRVRIYELDIEAFSPPEVVLRIVCSRGTYIRALARDVGLELGCGAFVRRLCRTRVGPYRIEQALQLADVERDFCR